jgi:hypothetical protein
MLTIDSMNLGLLLLCAAGAIILAWLAFVPMRILAKKNYEPGSLFGIFLLTLLTWPIAFCVALILPDRNERGGQIIRETPPRKPALPQGRVADTPHFERAKRL